MPHVVVKLYAGRSDAQKHELAQALSEALIKVLGSSEASVSVAIQDVAPADWPEAVYRPDILERPEQIYRAPGYDPFS